MDKEISQLETIIIGGGQAGLSTGYFLKMAGRQFVILDENSRIGDSWRRRWDSLKLFTPARHDGLPGMPFPGLKDDFPGKDEMGDYLENYVTEFSLPVSLNTKVKHLSSQNGHFEVETETQKFEVRNVVVATGTNPIPFIPAISSGMSSDIIQLHSSEYANPGSIPRGDVLVVGAATSGIEIALELSKTHTTFISGKPTFHIPDAVIKYGGELYWWLVNNLLTIRTPLGRKAKQNIIHGGSPLLRISARDLDKVGIKRLPRVTGSREGFPELADKSIIHVRSIIWATGYKPDFSWIEMEVTDETGWPVTQRGVSMRKKGLYFVGMPFQFGLTSGLVGGVGRDAAFVSNHILHN